ncbi:MAG: PilZ domain-containing protein [Candidatus Omnitrophica bacterium]|nr:PilZ domain-containing protein [Candidatus Omnitrophota bacterium]MDD4012720.1 PilZ domain-containing protein [Candidatus Omnitrophota bacterium]
MGEKRRFMRFNVLMDAICRTGNSMRKLKINNFSREGLGVLSRECMNPGDQVEIEMSVPGDNMPVVFLGEVAWAMSPEADNQNYRGGVRFKDIKNSDRSRILGYIYQKWIMPAGVAQ